MNETTYPRRSILFSLAAASVAAAACSGSSGAETQDGGSPHDSGGGGREAGKDASAAADVELLNGLLADEYSALAAYGAAAPYLGKPTASDPLAAIAPVVLQVALHFASQHTDHAAVLVTAIKSLKGTPVKQSSVKFMAPSGFSLTVTNIMKLAANAERAAAVVYSQTVEKLSVATNRYLAAAISGDEAQHFIVLDALLQGVAQPGPNLSASTAKNVVPASFLASQSVGQSLSDIADFDVTM